MTDSLKNFFGNNPNRPRTKVQEVSPSSLGAKIKVIGVGGSGNNTLNHIIKAQVSGIDTIALNTDAQALDHNNAAIKINIGKKMTGGLGAGSDPTLGQKSAEESSEEIKAHLENADMAFVTCGMGGGTGTGAAPVVASLAKEAGALTIGVVTKPFTFEGEQRRERAENGLKELKEKVDALILIPNDKILSIIDKKTPVMDALKVADDILLQGVQGIAGLITSHGMINVDFADVKNVMQNSGSALMGIGYGTGENRAVEAARAAINSPLLEQQIDGAKGLLVNVAGGNDLSMLEVEESIKTITSSVHPQAEITFGTEINDGYTGEVKITVIATNFDEKAVAEMKAKRNNFQKPRTTQEELEIPAFIRKKMQR